MYLGADGATESGDLCSARRVPDDLVGLPPEGRRHEQRLDRPGHDRPGSRTLDDPTLLGELGPLLQKAGLPRSRAGLPRFRSRRRGPARRPLEDRHAHRPGDGGPPGGSHCWTDKPPIIIGHSFGGTLTQRPWPRRGRGGDQLCSDRRCAGHAAIPGQVPVPDPRQPGQPPRAGRLRRSNSTTPSATP